MIVIVGAGVAGLSAAHRLLELGQRNVKILEARSRPGGRIASVDDTDGCRIDIGAQWLHGDKSNPVYEWLSELDLIEGPEEEDAEFEGLFRTQYGALQIPPKDVITNVLDVLLDTKHTLYRTASLLDPRSIRPVDIYRQRVHEALKERPVLRRADTQLVEAVVRWFEIYEMIDNSCEDLASLSMRAYSNWTDYDEGKMTCLRGGWSKAVSKLVDLVGRRRIVYDCEVKQIIYDNDSHVEIIHSQGSTKCDQVIVTVPLGVLKSLPDSFFKPPLARERRTAIERLGYGSINKIFLHFERPYLQTERGIKFLWLEHSSSPVGGPGNCKGYPVTQADRQPDVPPLPEWTHYLTGFETVRGQPQILLGWIGGKGALLMEQCSEETIGDTCLQLLARFAPDLERPPPLMRVTCSRWASDRYARGAYSYESRAALELEAGTLESLWEPLRGPRTGDDRKPRLRVMFAGEATAGRMSSTVHGAIVSGWREAYRLVEEDLQRDGGSTPTSTETQETAFN